MLSVLLARCLGLGASIMEHASAPDNCSWLLQQHHCANNMLMVKPGTGIKHHLLGAETWGAARWQ